MKQKWKMTLVVSLSMMFMAACGNSSTSSREESSNESTNNAATENVEAKVEGTLDFYTSQPDADAAKLVEVI